MSLRSQMYSYPSLKLVCQIIRGKASLLFLIVPIIESECCTNSSSFISPCESCRTYLFCLSSEWCLTSMSEGRPCQPSVLTLLLQLIFSFFILYFFNNFLSYRYGNSAFIITILPLKYAVIDIFSYHRLVSASFLKTLTVKGQSEAP